VDRARNVFIVAGNGSTWEAQIGNLSSGLNNVGSAPFDAPPGLCYVPGIGVVGWGGGEPYVYNGSGWSQLSSGGPAGPDSLGSYGVYGRLGYDATLHALVYAGRIDHNVWLYRF